MRRAVWLALLIWTACAPSVSVTPVESSAPSPTPVVVRDDLAPYRAAMRPEFAGDVDRFANATRYQIDLSISLDLKTIAGTQQVHYTNTQGVPLAEITFRLFANMPSYGGSQTINSVRVNGAVVEPKMELNNSAMRLALDPALQPGSAIDLKIESVTVVPTTPVDEGYNQFGYHDEVLTLPNVYPMIPVYGEAGWNVELGPGYGDAVYSDTALYQVTIRAPADQIVAASGVCKASDEGANRVWHCVSGPMRDFMIAMSAGYVVESTQVDEVTINSYALNTDAEAGAKALRFAAAAVESYQKRIGAYPFNELDVLETPTTALGIEYPGLIVVTGSAYDGGPTQEFTTVHEAAHQWWYSLVGNDQVDEPWLDESLTQFTSILYFQDRYGAAVARTLTQQIFAEGYDAIKSDGQDMRADLPVARYTAEQYGAIVYRKAPLFFDALYQKMGDAKFNAFLKTYFAAHRYGIAHPADLLAAAATQLDRATVDNLYREWITTPDQ